MAKQLRFIEGDVAIFNSTYLLYPASIHSHLRSLLNEGNSAKSGKLLYTLGFRTSKDFSEDLDKRFKVKGMESVALWRNIVELQGLAKINRISSNPDGSIIVGAISSLAKDDLRKNEKTKVVMDYFIAGFFAGIFTTIYDKEIECVETKCVCTGEAECVFILKPKTSGS
jgi:predicted hydrocarbon binding protein